jgi:hypothetical protein
MTQTFMKTLNNISKALWEKSDDGEISEQEIKKTIKVEAGYTVVDKYWDELHDFNRIEQVPETQTWIVSKPEKVGIEKTNTDVEKRSKKVLVPEDVLQAAKQYGVDFSKVFTQALIEEISDVRSFLETYMGGKYNDTESKYIFELFKKGLDTHEGRDTERARRDKRRRELYKDIFETSKADREHVGELRKKAAELGQIL